MEIIIKDARDVFYEPIYMKKNRPAYKLSVIAKEENVEKIVNNIFKNSSTIGVRKIKMNRDILPRKSEIKNSSLGEVIIKNIYFDGKEYKRYEYESLKKIALDKNMSIREVRDILNNEIK